MSRLQARVRELTTQQDLMQRELAEVSQAAKDSTEAAKYALSCALPAMLTACQYGCMKAVLGMWSA